VVYFYAEEKGQECVHLVLFLWGRVHIWHWKNNLEILHFDGVMIKKLYIFLTELFYSVYKSVINQQTYLFELTKALYSFAFNLLSSEQMKVFWAFPFSFHFSYWHKVGFISQKPKCQYFLKQWHKTSDPVPAWDRTLNFGPMAQFLRWLKVVPEKHGIYLEYHFVHFNSCLGEIGFQFSTCKQKKRHFL
jgi:hypothetical protein